MKNNSSFSADVFRIYLRHLNDFTDNAYASLQADIEFKRHGQLYHYTTLESLQKIIESQSLRATSIYMLNDPNELQHGYEQILKWFNGELDISGLTSDRYKSIYGFPAFVFSLTELSDDMHFWEKYGNKHKGVRIGFSPPELLTFWRKLKLANVILAPVIYQDYDHQFIGDYAKSFIEFKHNFSKEINSLIAENKVDSSELQNLAYCSSLTASLIKRKEWALEKEWRIICIPLGHVHESIIGDLSTGTPMARLVNQGEEVLDLLTNSNGAASRDILKIGHLSGNKEFVQFAVELIFKKTTGKNFFTDNISESSIMTR